MTLGPTVRDTLETVTSSAGEEGRGVRSADRSGVSVVDCGRDLSECRCETWKMCPQAKPTKISRSGEKIVKETH